VALARYSNLAPFCLPRRLGLALAVCAFAMLAGFDRDRVFYPTLLTVIATYYILVAVIGRSTPALAIESAVAGTFLVLAVVGFKKNLWLVARPVGTPEARLIVLIGPHLVFGPDRPLRTAQFVASG
jgi:hypothetical protein